MFVLIVVIFNFAVVAIFGFWFEDFFKCFFWYYTPVIVIFNTEKDPVQISFRPSAWEDYYIIRLKTITPFGLSQELN